jgi:hypothetical protein
MATKFGALSPTGPNHPGVKAANAMHQATIEEAKNQNQKTGKNLTMKKKRWTTKKKK